jgi:hypothetical protein
VAEALGLRWKNRGRQLTHSSYGLSRVFVQRVEAGAGYTPTPALREALFDACKQLGLPSGEPRCQGL